MKEQESTEATGRRYRAPWLTVQLTDEQIEAAIPRDSGHCMFAEAVKGAFPSAKYVSVDLQTIRFTDSIRGVRYTYLTPRRCQVALVAFDQGIRTEPFRFQLRGGHVTAARYRGKVDATRSEVAKQRRRARDAQAREMAKTDLRPSDAGPNCVPERVGGKTPPLAPLARRRSFGIRALDK